MSEKNSLEITILRATVCEGELRKKGDILKAPTAEAKLLINIGKAIAGADKSIAKDAAKEHEAKVRSMENSDNIQALEQVNTELEEQLLELQEANDNLSSELEQANTELTKLNAELNKAKK